MNARGRPDKALRAAAAAEALLGTGDPEGGRNSACCAMVDAARTALPASSAPVGQESARTQHGVLGTFSVFPRKIGRVPADSIARMGRGRILDSTAADPLAALHRADAPGLVEEFAASLA